MTDETSSDNSSSKSSDGASAQAETATEKLNQAPGVEPTVKSQNWEREVIAQIAMASLHEQKMNRIWNIIFRSAYLLMFMFFVYAMYLIASVTYNLYQPLISGKGAGDGEKGHTALIELNSEISSDSASSADNLVAGLRAAVKDPNTKGVIIRANSPGGSPVESAYVYDEINRLRKLHPKMKFYTVIKDGCFSGCYFIASATDKIYANRASLVGSIGVIHMSFGITELMKKVGVQPRVIATGDNKAFLSMFQKLNPNHVAHMKTILAETFKIFKHDVIKGRGSRLKINTPDLFSGLIWNARQAKEIGLIDDFGSTGYVARKVIGAKVIKDFTPRRGWWKGFLGGVKNSVTQTVKQSLMPAPSVQVIAH